MNTGSVSPGVTDDATLLSNGDIVTLGGYGLARFLPNGKLDSTFGSGGFSAPVPGGTGFGALTVQPDGKFVVVGSAQGPNGSEFAAARYNSNGTLDTGFATNGVATSQSPFSHKELSPNRPSLSLCRPTGRSWWVGSSRSSGTNHRRLGPPSCASTPTVLSTAHSAPGARCLPVVRASTTSPPSAWTRPATSWSFLLTLSSVPPASSTTPHTRRRSRRPPRVQRRLPGQRAVRSCHLRRSRQERRRHPGSALQCRWKSCIDQPDFDYSGAAGVDQGEDSAGGLAIQPNGQAVVGGAQFLGTDLFGLARVNANGSLDTSFGNGGVLMTNIPNGFGFAAVLVQPDGRIIGVGSGQASGFGDTEIVLARYFG